MHGIKYCSVFVGFGVNADRLLEAWNPSVKKKNPKKFTTNIYNLFDSNKIFLVNEVGNAI